MPSLQQQRSKVSASIDATNYLFIESGGFSDQNKADWKTQWSVMKRESNP